MCGTIFPIERNLAVQAPLLHASTSAASGCSGLQATHLNNSNLIRNDPINTSNSNAITPSTTLTPLVNAKIQPPTQMTHEQMNPSQYTISTLQQPTSPLQHHHAQHVQYPHALQAVLHPVYFIFIQHMFHYYDPISMHHINCAFKQNTEINFYLNRWFFSSNKL